MTNYNYHYPEYILKVLRQREDMEEDDKSRDEEFQTLAPEYVFAECLEWEGLIHFETKIHSLIEGVYGIALRPDDLAYNEQTREEFVRGLGNLFRAFPHDDSCGVKTMEMDENELVTVTFKGGGTKTANVAMDSRKAIISDIIKQAL